MVKCKVCEKDINEVTVELFGGCCPECFDRDCPTCLIFKQQRDRAVKLLGELWQFCKTDEFYKDSKIEKDVQRFLDELKEAKDG